MQTGVTISLLVASISYLFYSISTFVTYETKFIITYLCTFLSTINNMSNIVTLDFMQIMTYGSVEFVPHVGIRYFKIPFTPLFCSQKDGYPSNEHGLNHGGE